MNLYLFNANDSAAIYGIGTYLNELFCALERTSINVHIVHLHSVRSEFEIEKTNQIENWFIPEVRNQYTFSGTIQKLENYCRNVIYILRLYIRDQKDLIFHFNFNQYQFLARELKTVFDCKTVTTVHYTKWSLELLGNLSLFHRIKSKPNNQRNSYEQLLLITDAYESLLYQEVDRVITLSYDMKHFICNEYHIDPSKIVVIQNGLKIDNLQLTMYNKRKADKSALREKWQTLEKEYIILFAGRLHPVKGLMFLIRSFRDVLLKQSNCRLIIAGSGNYDIYIQEVKDIRTKIMFTGLLKKKELYELYRMADIGVVPSLHEPFGYVAVEMMMHCLPVIATTTSGLNEVVDDSCGLKVPVIEHHDNVEIDTGLLAEKIISLIQNPEKALELGKNGRKRYEMFFTSVLFRRNMLNFYQSLFKQ